MNRFWKKCLIFIIFLLINTNQVMAKTTLMTCKYKSDDNKTSLSVTIYDNFSHKAVITSYKGKSLSNDESIQNWDTNGTSYGIQHYVKYSGLCPSHAGILKQLVWGFSIYVSDLPTVTQKVESYDNHVVLSLNNPTSQNINNLKAYLNLKPATTCKYQDRATTASITLPNVYYGGIYYATGGSIGGGKIVKEGTCPTNVYKICVGTNCSYTFSLSSPYLCSNNDYKCTKLPDTTTTKPNEPSTQKGEKHYSQVYNTTGTFKALTFTTSYDFDKGYSTSTNMKISDYSDSVNIAYSPDITTFIGNVLDPIINSNKWPDQIYCSKMSATMKLNTSAVMVVGDQSGFVCSPQKNVFSGTSTLTIYKIGSATNQNNNNNNNSTNGTGNVTVNPSEPIKCSDFETKEGINLISEIFTIIMIIAPILLIVYGSIDFGKATLSSDEQALKKAGTDFGKRTIAAVLLFLLPLILNIILKIAFDAGVFGNMTEIPETCINQK